ncbi:hypothetical protein RF11_11336 [Thelohanellus kitauei]|uniref:Uncharacterized protein n=1 Tax=Thelohanellus kitauei TaxID=669202 RepID=A0A0C2MQR5_THEKT|nr:hypothetical protein RF11_11336 [Thelohanellus kitauei]
MNMDMNVEEGEQTKKALIISRVLHGEVDVYKRTSHQPMTVTIELTPNRVPLNNGIPSPTEKTSLSVNAKICYKNIIVSQDLKVSLKFLHSPESYSIEGEWILDDWYWPITTQNVGCENYLIYLRPWFQNTPIQWIFQAEIVQKQTRDDTNTREPPVLLQRKFFSEIIFEKSCRKPKYASIISPCDVKIYNEDEEFKHFLLNDDSVDSTKSQIRVLYSTKIEYNEYFQFTILASCPQFFVNTNDPVLQLSIQSFFPYAQKSYAYKAKSMMEHEFFIETKTLPPKTQRICKKTETEINFNIDICIKGLYYDDNLAFTATVYLDDTDLTAVTAIQIHSNHWDVIYVGDTTMQGHSSAFRKFRIKKSPSIDESQLRVTATLKNIYKHNFIVKLKIEPQIGYQSAYTLKSIMMNEASFQKYLVNESCKMDIFLIILAICIACAVSVGLCVLVYYKIYIRFFSKISVPLYLMEHITFPE